MCKQQQLLHSVQLCEAVTPGVQAERRCSLDQDREWVIITDTSTAMTIGNIREKAS